MTTPTCTTYRRCQVMPRLSAPCSVCSEYSDPRHVVETDSVDEYGTLVTKTTCYCGRDCPVCKEETHAL